MSGHSKWSTIKRQKGVADIKRGQTFTKVANAITIAVKSGGSGDPESNPHLRMVLEQARGVNMPKDNMQRAIDRGLGKGGAQALEEVFYEGFGPGKVAFVVEGVTDNKMRTTQEVKNIFERNGGSLAGQGSVSYMFDKKGEIKAKGKGGNGDDEMLELIDLGAEDVEDFKEDGLEHYLVYVQPENLNAVKEKINQAGFNIDSAELVLKPNIVTEIIDQEIAKKIVDFAEKLEDLDDVQKVYANFDIPDNLIPA